MHPLRRRSCPSSCGTRRTHSRAAPVVGLGFSYICHESPTFSLVLRPPQFRSYLIENKQTLLKFLAPMGYPGIRGDVFLPSIVTWLPKSKFVPTVPTARAPAAPRHPRARLAPRKTPPATDYVPKLPAHFNIALTRALHAIVEGRTRLRTRPVVPPAGKAEQHESPNEPNCPLCFQQNGPIANPPRNPAEPTETRRIPFQNPPETQPHTQIPLTMYYITNTLGNR